MQEYQVKVRNEAIKTTSTHFLNAFISEFFAKCFFCQGPITQPAITCSKLTIDTLEQGVKYVLYC